MNANSLYEILDISINPTRKKQQSIASKIPNQISSELFDVFI